MRVLILRRQAFGSAKTLPNGLAAVLDQSGIEVVIDDADWIPDRTGFQSDKETSKKVKDAAKGFDLVHAWGYRAAWACSEAFYLRFPWLYTAYDMPKTTREELVDRLNAAHRGVCSSYSVRSALDSVDVLNLETVMPGVVLPEDEPQPVIERTEARKLLGLRDDSFVIFAAGRFVPERGFDALIDSFAQVRACHRPAQLVLTGAGPEPPPLHQDGVTIRGPVESVWPWLCAADLVVVPSRSAGFSLLAAEAMWCGAPVLMRSTGGLADMAEDGLNAFYFEDDGTLASKILEVVETSLTRESVARGGQLRAQARFTIDRYAKEMEAIYRDVAGA